MTDVLKIKETNSSISLIEENINHNTKSYSNQIDIEYQFMGSIFRTIVIYFSFDYRMF